MRTIDPKTERLEIRMSKREREMVEALGRREGLTPSGVVRHVIRSEHRRIEKQEGRASSR
jgi:hypothetical protein